jgi:hypothetical protein
MKPTKKTLLVLLCTASIVLLSSCHRGTGCPTWGKVKSEQIGKKSV